MASFRIPLADLEMAHGRMFPFVPVGLGIGIGIWFGLDEEPGAAFYMAVAGASLALAGVAAVLRRHWPGYGCLAVFAACILAGVLAAGARLAVVSAPILDGDYYGPVTGRVVEIDRSQGGALRITLDRVWLARVEPEEVPRRVRLSLQGEEVWHRPRPGQIVMTTAFLSAPRGPLEPGAFDFRQMAFFAGLGAVGYTRSPVLLWEEVPEGGAPVGRLRLWLSDAIQARIPGDAGAFAAGVLTGDRSGLSVEAVAALRDSSLAHLLAISGMNMAFLVAFVFGILRYGIALVPPAALRIDGKKIAAAMSLGVAFCYLLLSGANVATERAFIMVSVMLVAVLIERRAITLRSLAIAATVLLLWQPEALLSAGFQMSFAATAALIAGFAWLSDRREVMRWPWAARWGLALIASSVLGGVATAPFAAAHFNRFSDYGLLANILTGPVMGTVVMPAGVMAGILAPFGLAGPALWVLEQGCRWILFVAREVAALEGAVTAIRAPSAVVLPLLALGLCWALFWSGALRWLGLLPVLAALGIWWGGERPIALIGPGGLVGLDGAEGRAISAARGGGFMVANWLANDGDLATQRLAAARPGFREVAGGRMFEMGAGRGIILDESSAADAACRLYSVVILRETASASGRCLLIDEALLAHTGVIALERDGDVMRAVPTNGTARRWTGVGRAAVTAWPAE